MLFHKLDDMIGVDIGPKFSFACFTSRPCVDVWILVPLSAWWIARFPTRPHRPVIKAMLFHCQWFDPEIVDLPLSGSTGFVAQVFH